MSSDEHNIIKKLFANTGNREWHLSCIWWIFDGSSFWKILCSPVKTLHKIHHQKSPFRHRCRLLYYFIVLLILVFLVQLKHHKSQHMLLCPNFTLCDSTGLYGVRYSPLFLYYKLLLLCTCVYDSCVNTFC